MFHWRSFFAVLYLVMLSCASTMAASLLMLGGPSDAETYERAFNDFQPPSGISFTALCLNGDSEKAIAAAKAAAGR